LKNFDYAQEGFYFITICIKKHQCVLGKIINSKMNLNEIGEIVRREWLKTAELRPNVKLHNFVVMPNHFHGILEIVKKEWEINNDLTKHDTSKLPKSRFQNQGKNTMSSIIGSFKSSATKNIHLAGYDFAWQRNLYEHIIRNHDDYIRIDNYITNNPLHWWNDCFYIT
jgi:REP element-mobilizing transposase RayT